MENMRNIFQVCINILKERGQLTEKDLEILDRWKIKSQNISDRQYLSELQKFLEIEHGNGPEVAKKINSVTQAVTTKISCVVIKGNTNAKQSKTNP